MSRRVQQYTTRQAPSLPPPQQQQQWYFCCCERRKTQLLSRGSQKTFYFVVVIVSVTIIVLGNFIQLYQALTLQDSSSIKGSITETVAAILPQQQQQQQSSVVLTSQRNNNNFKTNDEDQKSNELPLQRKWSKISSSPRIIFLIDSNTSLATTSVMTLQQLQEQQQHNSTTSTSTSTILITTSSSRTVEALTVKQCRYCRKVQRLDPPLYKPILKRYYEDCIPMADWQITYHPTCNVIHEIPFREESLVSSSSFHEDEKDSNEDEDNDEDGNSNDTDAKNNTSTEEEVLDDDKEDDDEDDKDETTTIDIPTPLSLLDGENGGIRSVWRVEGTRQFSPIAILNTTKLWNTTTNTLRSSPTPSSSSSFFWHDDPPNQPPLVLKVLHFRHPMNHDFFRLNIRGAMAADQLTKSKRIISIWGYCGQSELNEVATKFGSDIIDETTEGSISRYHIGLEVARALRDVHSVDYPNSTNVTLSHSDLHLDNIVTVGTQIKLNDFNRAVPLRVLYNNNTLSSSSSSSSCGYPNLEGYHRWRARETLPEFGYVDPGKADVFALGSFFYNLLTSSEPFKYLEPGGKLDRKEVIKRKRNGYLIPYVPLEYVESNNTIIQLLYQAFRACCREYPNDRPTSHELVVALEAGWEWIMKGNITNRNNSSSSNSSSLNIPRISHEDIRRLFLQ